MLRSVGRASGRASGRHEGGGRRLADTDTWRPDIQGLRAIAVLSVVLFHLNVQPVKGGFVGVDVFFVISGYLISRGIFIEAAESRFSLLRFYERRARRLLPVFLIVAIATTLFAYAVLFPPQLVEYARSLVASSLFATNIYFFATHDYFSPSPDSLPLLHLWSLGVEEQFYLLFPLLALLGARLAPNRRRVSVVLLGLGSFGLSAALTHRFPTAAFYLLPFRAFEFLIGSYLALPQTAPPRSPRLAATAAWTGLVALVVSVLGFSTRMDFPGAWAAAPCVGTGLLIWAGTGRATAPTRGLSAGHLTFIGNISYSLYLVHWPIIVISGEAFPAMNPALRAPVLLALAILLSTVLFYTVEEPVRRARPWHGRSFLAGSAGSLVLVAAVGCFVIQSSGFPGRVEARSVSYLSYLRYDSAGLVRSRRCFLDGDQRPEQFEQESCLPEHEPGKRLAVIWGDSVAAHLYPGLSDALARDGVVLGQATASACPPTLHYDAPQRPWCASFNEFALRLILERKPALVIVACAWGDLAALDYAKEPIQRLLAASIPVVLLGPAAFYKVPVPTMLARRLAIGERTLPTEADMLDYVALSEVRVQALATEVGVPFVSLMQAYCPDGHCPLTTDTDVPLEFDPVHFTRDGSRYVADRIIRAFPVGFRPRGPS